ncbi:MAG: hypothetical protein WCJ19_01570 [bacterium]
MALVSNKFGSTTFIDKIQTTSTAELQTSLGITQLQDGHLQQAISSIEGFKIFIKHNNPRILTYKRQEGRLALSGLIFWQSPIELASDSSQSYQLAWGFNDRQRFDEASFGFYLIHTLGIYLSLSQEGKTNCHSRFGEVDITRHRLSGLQALFELMDLRPDLNSSEQLKSAYSNYKRIQDIETVTLSSGIYIPSVNEQKRRIAV